MSTVKPYSMGACSHYHSHWYHEPVGFMVNPGTLALGYLFSCIRYGHHHGSPAPLAMARGAGSSLSEATPYGGCHSLPTMCLSHGGGRMIQ